MVYYNESSSESCKPHSSPVFPDPYSILPHFLSGFISLAFAPALDKREERLNNAKTIQGLALVKEEKLAKEWKKLVNQPIERFFPFMENPRGR